MEPTLTTQPVPSAPPSPEDDVATVHELAEARRLLLGEIEKRIVGQRDVVDHLLTALFARGHCLFVGVPVKLGAKGVEQIIRDEQDMIRWLDQNLSKAVDSYISYSEIGGDVDADSYGGVYAGGLVGYSSNTTERYMPNSLATSSVDGRTDVGFHGL